MSNSEIIEWLKKKAETVTMPGARKMYQAAVKALEEQKDMVSRKTANVAICNACGKIDCDKMDKCEKLQLPPVNNSEIPNSYDTISRAKAIEAINKALDRQTLLNRFVRKVAIDAIKQLPPAQPEIIRCKDCRFSDSDATCCLVCCRDGQGLKFAHVRADNFCSYAERKTE